MVIRSVNRQFQQPFSVAMASMVLSALDNSSTMVMLPC